MMLENLERERENLIENYKRRIDEIKEELRDQIEHTSITLEDYLATGMILHKRVNDRDHTILQKDQLIETLRSEIEDLKLQIKHQIELRDKNRHRYEKATMMLDEEQTMHEYFRDELHKTKIDNKNLISSLNIKNKAYENLMIEKNKIKTSTNRLKALIKKIEQDAKFQRTKNVELKQEISTLNEEQKLANKERTLYFLIILNFIVTNRASEIRSLKEKLYLMRQTLKSQG